MVVACPLQTLSIKWLQLEPKHNSHHSITVARKEYVREQFVIKSMYNLEIHGNESIYSMLCNMWSKKEELNITAKSVRGEELEGTLCLSGKPQQLPDSTIVLTMITKENKNGK